MNTCHSRVEVNKGAASETCMQSHGLTGSRTNEGFLFSSPQKKIKGSFENEHLSNTRAVYGGKCERREKEATGSSLNPGGRARRSG